MRGQAAALVLAAVAASSVRAESSPLEAQAEQATRQAYSAAKLAAPVHDEALARAARALASRAVEKNAREATQPELMADVLSRAGAWDPPPRAVVVRASTARRAAEAIAERTDLASTSATHLGAGVVEGASMSAAVLLLSERKTELDPFPRLVKVGEKATLSGKLVFPLHSARVYVTPPSGVARQEAPGTAASAIYEAKLSFPSPGTYTVEVVAESVKGPEVAALFRVVAGTPTAVDPSASVVPETKDLAKAESQVLMDINQRRARHGVAALSRSSLLDSAAAEHAAEMVRMNYFAHVSPVSGDVGQRLTREGFAWERVTENLGEAASALEAHRQIESSPGHLANVLDAGVDLVGLSAVRVKRGSIDNVILVQVFARKLTEKLDLREELLGAVNAERARRKLRPLVHNEDLDKLAQGHANDAKAAGNAALSLKGRSLTERALDFSNVRSAAADLLVTGTPSQVGASKNLATPGFNALGMGVSRGPFGPRGETTYCVVLLFGALEP